ncbi:hypothetical protein UlMin_008076 [Ulmus minor]
MTFRGKGGRFCNHSRPICQVCGKIGHIAAHCYYKFDNNYMGAPLEANKNIQHSVFVATPDMLNDPAWYADSRASTHVMNDASNLNQKQNYTGKESLVVGNGQRLDIAHIGQGDRLGDASKQT